MILRRLFPGLFHERTKSGARIYVNQSGTTSVRIEDVRKLAMELSKSNPAIHSPSIPWVSCATRSPIAAGQYLCFEPDIGPGPDFVFLRWDTDRGWRDDNDNKGFPTHWVGLNRPYVEQTAFQKEMTAFPYG
jgi:hypothetical protein